MQRSVSYLVLVISLIGVGMALSFYGAQLSTQDLTVQEQSIISGDSMEISADLDPSIAERGVFVIQTFDYEGNGITAKVFDPNGFELFSQEIGTDSIEERFEIDSKGSYKLVIENFGSEEAHVAGVIGHMPNDLTLSIGLTGFYLLIVGLIGTVGVGIYVVKNKKKRQSN